MYSAASQFYTYHELVGEEESDPDGTERPVLPTPIALLLGSANYLSSCVNFLSYLCLCSSLIPDPNIVKSISFLKTSSNVYLLRFLLVFFSSILLSIHTLTSSLPTCPLLSYIVLRDMSDLSLNPHYT